MIIFNIFFSTQYFSRISTSLDSFCTVYFDVAILKVVGTMLHLIIIWLGMNNNETPCFYGFWEKCPEPNKLLHFKGVYWDIRNSMDSQYYVTKVSILSWDILYFHQNTSKVYYQFFCVNRKTFVSFISFMMQFLREK